MCREQADFCHERITLKLNRRNSKTIFGKRRCDRERISVLTASKTDFVPQAQDERRQNAPRGKHPFLSQFCARNGGVGVVLVVM